MKNKNLKIREHYSLKSIVVKDKNDFDFSEIKGEFDLVLEEGFNTINFIHLTYDDCVDSIMENGFIPGEGDFGIGVYCANLNDSKSIQSLRYFARTDLFHGEDKVAIIMGNYSGIHTRCMKATSNDNRHYEDFYLLEDVSKINNLSGCIIDRNELEYYLLRLEKRAICNEFKIAL